MKKYLFFILITSLLALIFIFPSVTYDGALAGLNLWLFNILPTMLPCLIITDILKKINGIYLISKLPAKFFTPILGISKISSYAILGGMICGYPLGAKLICDLYSDKSISKNEAEYLLTFSNNPGPIFISTYIFNNLLNNQYKALGFAVIYTSIFITALIFNINYRNKSHYAPTANHTSNKLLSNSITTIDNSIYNSFYIIIKIGGYIILFSLITSLINNFLAKKNIFSVVVIGMFEMTTGIYSASLLNCSTYSQMVIMCCLCILGGLCTTLQTYSIINNYNLSLKKYIISKFTTTFIALLLFSILKCVRL
ncbi:MAG: hypothetical protein IJC76_02635 [Lachnospiraceae bacterium]|nr:hypothetical protein [Lachnospiraceae bacterium]